MSSTTPATTSLLSSRKKVAIHLLFWVVYAFINYLLSYNLLGNLSFAIGFALVTLLFNLVLVYFHLLYLLPRFFVLRQYRLYLVLLVLAILGIAMLRLLGLEGVSDYAQVSNEPSFAVKVSISVASSIIVLLITVPFFFLDDWLNATSTSTESDLPADNSQERAYFFIKSDNKLVKIFFDEISYVESLRDLVRIHTESGKHLSQHSMRKMMEILPEDQFVRVHRTYIIAFHKIQAVSGNVIEIGEQKIPIGKTYREAFFQRLEVL